MASSSRRRCGWGRSCLARYSVVDAAMIGPRGASRLPRGRWRLQGFYSRVGEGNEGLIGIKDGVAGDGEVAIVIGDGLGRVRRRWDRPIGSGRPARRTSG